MDDLENVDLPPFPSNLKSRTGSTSKDTIELLDAAFVKQKIVSHERNTLSRAAS